MSEFSFMHNEENGRLLIEVDAGYRCKWPIRVFDIGEKNFVGAVYPDGARQVQCLSWWQARLDKAGAKLGPIIQPRRVKIERVVLKPRRILIKPRGKK